MKVKIASAQYDIGFLENWDAFDAKIKRWVSEAASNGANILVFPEYAWMELAAIFGEDVYRSLKKQLLGLQLLHTDFVYLFSDLARLHHCYIQAGTFPVRIKSGAYRNRAYLFRPDGSHDFQEKLMMTRFENEQWFIEAGDEIKCFDTEYGKIAINVCYDIEFPLLARKQVEDGALIILAPSCTDTVAGFNRVKLGCQARALESQCYVVQSALVGEAPWSEAVDVNVGASGVFTPVDFGFPDDGVLVMGDLNAVGWVYADISPDALATVRAGGQVFNYKDWPLQNRFFN